VLALLQAQQALPSMADSPSAQNEADRLSKALQEQLKSLKDAEGVPRASWKTIIRDMEVGARLCSHMLFCLTMPLHCTVQPGSLRGTLAFPKQCGYDFSMLPLHDHASSIRSLISCTPTNLHTR
jgi:hypothetical protein